MAEIRRQGDDEQNRGHTPVRFLCFFCTVPDLSHIADETPSKWCWTAAAQTWWKPAPRPVWRSCDKPFSILWFFSFSPSSIESPLATILPNRTFFSTNYPATIGCISKFKINFVNYIMLSKQKAISLYKKRCPRPQPTSSPIKKLRQ